MNIYIDESGSINNHNPTNKYFIIAMVHVLDKKALYKAYKRFVSSNMSALKHLDKEKRNAKGKITKPGNKMFRDDKFVELKGSQFDRAMKIKFLDFFSSKKHFEVYYIKIDNELLSDKQCAHTARVFNYAIRQALEYFIKNGLLPDENCYMQLDERGEDAKSKYFLANYLNTELIFSGKAAGPFDVVYFDSSQNRFVQIADVFANVHYSQLKKAQYTKQFEVLEAKGMLRGIYEFPQ